MNPTSTHLENQGQFAARCCLGALCVNRINVLLRSVAVECCLWLAEKPSGFCAVVAVSADFKPGFESGVGQKIINILLQDFSGNSLKSQL